MKLGVLFWRRCVPTASGMIFHQTVPKSFSGNTAAFNKLPKHVRSIDVGAFTVDGKEMKSFGRCGEFFILTEYVDGTLYHCDLDRIKAKGEITDLDEKRCLALSDYLVEIHSA
jgi:hypothetical protein